MPGGGGVLVLLKIETTGCQNTSKKVYLLGFIFLFSEEKAGIEFNESVCKI